MRFLIIVLVLLLSSITFVFAQAPDTLWSGVYGGSANDNGTKVRPTSDCGYVVIGHSASFGTGENDAYMVKLDTQGNEVWSHYYGGEAKDEAYNIFQTTDGGYVFAGKTESYGAGGCDFWLVKTTSDGTEQWSRTYGGAGDDDCFGLDQTSDGGYILSGYTESFAANDKDVWIVKTDQNGDSLWSSVIDHGDTDAGQIVKQTTDGGYIIIGYTSFTTANFYDVLLLKTDTGGNEEWFSTFGAGFVNSAYNGRVAADGGYIIAAYSYYLDQTSEGLIIKTDASGNEEWSNLCGGSGGYAAIQDVMENDDGVIIGCGYTTNYGAGAADVYLVGYDAGGSEQWYTTVGSDSSESGFGITKLDDGFVVTGMTQSWGAGAEDYYVVRFGEGTSVEYPGFNAPFSFSLLTAYPNPFNQSVALNYELPAAANINLSVYDITGREIASLVNGRSSPGEHQVIWDAEGMTSGVYFVRLEAGDFAQTQKVMLVK